MLQSEQPPSSALESRTGRLEILTTKFVPGGKIAQNQAFVSTGNAELGFVALS
jgi:hypothetical protein